MAWTKRSGIQLCYPFEEARLKRWNVNTVVAQPKLDGDRCRAIIDSMGMPTLYSSEGNIIESVPHINEQLYNMKLTNIELDGELYTHNTAHQYIHGIVSRTVNMHSDFESIEYHIFDIIEGKKQADRLLQLAEIKHIIADKGIKNIRIVPFNAIDASIEAVTDKMDSYISSGYEGIIIRHPFAIYERKRSIYIMKFKPRKDDYYTITGTVEEVSQYGELKDTLGALILDSDNLDVNMEPQTFQVGSGSFLTREKRKELWENRSTLVGAMAHIKYQHLTDRGVPRFPVLVNIIQPN